MNLLASTIPQSLYASAVPDRHKAIIKDSAWLMVGSVSRMLDPQQAMDFLPWHRNAKGKYEKAADLAVEKGFDTVVFDCETYEDNLDTALKDPRSAKLAMDAVALASEWMRKRQPKLKLAYYAMCPAWAAMNLTEDTAPDTLKAYEALLAVEQKVLAPDVVVVDCYYAGPGWFTDLIRHAWYANRFYPGKPIRVLLSPDDYSKPGNLFVGPDRWKQMLRIASQVGTPEIWTDRDSMPWADQAFDVAAAM